MMTRAIGSRKDFAAMEEDSLLSQYQDCVSDLICQDMVQKMREYVQHCQTSRLQHSINVSYYSFLICYKLGWDYRSAARAGLLHDLFFYDWRKKSKLRGNHAAWHPRVAYDNAKKICELNDIEKDAILKHMWPCTLVPPKYKESYVLTMVDKICAVMEATERSYHRVRWGRSVQQV